jgi:hypothetical protein
MVERVGLFRVAVRHPSASVMVHAIFSLAVGVKVEELPPLLAMVTVF